jgi:hypothetical protein
MTRVVMPRVIEAMKKPGAKQDGLLAKYGVGPWLLVGGYAANKMGGDRVRRWGDAAAVVGAFVTGMKLLRPEATSEQLEVVLLGVPPNPQKVSGESSMRLGASDLIQLAQVSGDDEDDDVSGDDEDDDVSGDDEEDY